MKNAHVIRAEKMIADAQTQVDQATDIGIALQGLTRAVVSVAETGIAIHEAMLGLREEAKLLRKGVK